MIKSFSLWVLILDDPGKRFNGDSVPQDWVVWLARGQIHYHVQCVQRIGVITAQQTVSHHSLSDLTREFKTLFTYDCVGSNLQTSYSISHAYMLCV